MISKKNVLLLIAVACSVNAMAQKNNPPGLNRINIYTTAQNTDYRLSPTGTIDLTNKLQPRETETVVIVDPSKTFQTMVGIGGALTDAAAETFYKLSADKQKEVLTAYYDTDKGIGYTFGRTSIQS